jgi:Fe-S-cluster-containing dehydrogenase component
MRSIDSDLRRLEDKREVFVANDQPFEAPAKEFVPGPLYKNIEEVMPELAERVEQSDASTEKKLPVDRRDFMRLFSAGAVLASAACVRRPVERAVPYVHQPDDFVPGVPNYYATTIDRVGVVVKTKEGRPVFIEGNPEHPLAQGTPTMSAMSELQALYHPERRKSPIIRYGTNRAGEAQWDEVYERLAAKVKDAKNIGFLIKGTTGHGVSFYKDFLKTLGQSEDRLYLYESNGVFNAISEAHRLAFGIDGIPRSDLRRTKLVVGVGAEFLDLSAVANVFEAKSWSVGHTFRNGQKGRFVQFESRLTVTGGKADQRFVIGVGDELGVALGLVEALVNRPDAKGTAAEKANIQAVVRAQADLINETKQRLGLTELDKLAGELLANKSLVLVGESGASTKNATLLQIAGIMANILVGAYADRLLFFDQGWFKNPGRPGDVARFLKDLPTLDMVFVVNCDPVHTMPKSVGLEAALAGKSVVVMNAMPSEIDEYGEFILNTHNPLEAWGDEELVAGFWSIQQPAVRPLANSRQAEDVLLWVAARLEKPMGIPDYRSYIRNKWQAIYKESGINKDYETFFKAIQRKGFFVTQLSKRDMPAFGEVEAQFKPAPRNAGLKLVAHFDTKLFDGYGADRPVLQEAGDSLTTIVWDTWVAMHPAKAKELGLKYNDLVVVKGPAGSFEASVYPLPGLHLETIAVPRGRGQKAGLTKVTEGIGVNPLIALASESDPLTGDIVTAGQTVEITKTGKRYRLAAMQKHNDIANRRDILQVIPLQTAAKNARETKDLDDVIDLYPPLLPKEGDLRSEKSFFFPEWRASSDYRWGMSIDLERCIGCGACTVACDLENNIPQIGREQVMIGREMHWIRIDRYFSGPVDNPELSYQPVPCQHCNHAPCEAVCPVYATTHDQEGMNVQTYNRCVGTRYCANACPYKVRRFNWFTHKWNIMGDSPMDRNPRALNPDVSVRTRGVMEKCTFCVQRIREAKHNAKQQGRLVFDGEIRTACQTACPTDAITFGNLRDPNSRVARNRKDYRAYLLLGGRPELKEYGLKTLPNVNYMAKVLHDGSAGFAAGDGHEHGHSGHEHP